VKSHTTQKCTFFNKNSSPYGRLNTQLKSQEVCCWAGENIWFRGDSLTRSRDVDCRSPDWNRNRL